MVTADKNEVGMFTRFDQRGNPCRNSNTIIWKRRGAKQRAEDFRKCDDRVLAHILEKKQWVQEIMHNRKHILQENAMIVHMLVQEDGNVNAQLLTWEWWWQGNHMNRTQTGKDSALKRRGKGVKIWICEYVITIPVLGIQCIQTRNEADWKKITKETS